MTALRYRHATLDDAERVAELHAESWRVHYRGAYSDAFLDGDVLQDRMGMWKTRLSALPSNQLVVVAVDDDELAGFACAFGREDEKWGTLLDNIHVRPDRQGERIGARLVGEVANWCASNYADCGVYLWVLKQNLAAQGFYKHHGAVDRGGEVFEPPGGGEIYSRRYVWTSVSEIVNTSHE